MSSRISSLPPTPPSRLAQRRQPSALPAWVFLVLILFFAPLVVLHEPVFGDGRGLIAAGAGVSVGLCIALIASVWRWRPLSIFAAVLTAYFLVGGPAALPTTTLFGVLPTAQTIQALALGVVRSWKDLLTVEPPASQYVGPALVPWMSGLVAACLAGYFTVYRGKGILGSVPMILFAMVGIGWGLAGQFPSPLPTIVWICALLAWWAFLGQKERIRTGEDIVIGRRAVAAASGQTVSALTATRSHSASVNVGRQMVTAMVSVVVVALGTGLSLSTLGSWTQRVVLRDVVDPPLKVYEFPSPLSAFRRLSTDLKEETLIEVSELPDGARLRIAALEVYDGTTFGIAPAESTGRAGYVPAGVDLPFARIPEGAPSLDLQVKTFHLSGPWLPTVGMPLRLEFGGDSSEEQQDGLYFDRWADAALTANSSQEQTYWLRAAIPPVWSDGQLSGVPSVPIVAPKDQQVPHAVGDLAAKVTQAERSSLGKARAIERYLSKEGFYSNEDHAQSRPGHRADRLLRMLEAEQLIGDDEQYAALMALMLHSLGINARVVMGAYPDAYEPGALSLRGADMHVWVEVEFEGVGWGRFDPTPPRDQVPQTEVPKPRSVPRPQVLQPPEPPEEPAELPPGTSDRGAKSDSRDAYPIPWGMIAGVSGILLLLAAPFLAIVVWKAMRRRSRRRGEPRRVMSGCWDEIVDLAVDSGARVDPAWTRQETAWTLAKSVWAVSAAGQGSAGAEGTPWEGDLDGLPRVVEIAQVVDYGTFSGVAVSDDQAAALWGEVIGARGALNRKQSWVQRMKRRLSLRSLRERRRQKGKARRRVKR